MFRYLVNRWRWFLAVAVISAVVGGVIGFLRVTADRRPDASPSPSRSVNFSVDPARVGDRSGNPSCELPVDSASRLQWREVQELRLDTGLPLAPGVSVEARWYGQEWELTITAPGGKPSTHRVSEDVVHLAFNGSCFRRLYRLTKPVTIYSESLTQRTGAQRFEPGEELVVTDAGTLDGKLNWTVEHGNAPEYGAFADDLKRAGTPSDEVPIGLWRDDPNGFFFQLQQPLKTQAGGTLPIGMRISLEATVSCGATRADDVIGFALYPDGTLNGNADARRGDLLAALPDLGRMNEPKARDWVTGTNESACPKK